MGRQSNLVSIIVPCCGQLEYTKLCVPSLLRHSRKPYELIFIDVGSIDGTLEYLAGVAAATMVPVEVVSSPIDAELAEVVQEAVVRARGDYVVLLNNDTVLTESWIEQLVSVANLESAIGIVGPMSNYAPRLQLVDALPYRLGPKKSPRFDGKMGGEGVLLDVSAVDQFAREWREKERGKAQEVDNLAGFCLLIKRELIDKIGMALDSPTDLGVFDTRRLILKSRQAGFKLACCRDLFIHHFGTRALFQDMPQTLNK